jgi:YHS domain-containing protein
MITAIETSEVQPVCPHCEKEITSILVKLIESIFGKRYLYFCSECRKVLGITHRKGFWMG